MSADPFATLQRFAIPGKRVYLVGAFDRGVTVHSQQVRALNLAWSLIETETVLTLGASVPAELPKEIAIVGGGFTGLTLAAALLKKRVHANITMFEQRDTLLPLQQGSDSRWLHPRIYDWPADGSDSSAALLPVLNWKAARASDVVVQVLAEWKRTVVEAPANSICLFCNTRHLQVRESDRAAGQSYIEWVGEAREPQGAGAIRGQGGSGQSKPFDIVVLAIGFGVEKDGAISYWRNETLGQPSLDSPRRTYVVSGQGDGAMIDLLRLRISQFRQDRILQELFAEQSSLVAELKALQHRYLSRDIENLFEAFEKLAFGNDIFARLASRLRRDTDVILKLKVRELSQLFANETSRISFQNKLLVYLLYRCGGFVPSTIDEKVLVDLHAMTPDRVVWRHGSDRDAQLKTLLSDGLHQAVKDAAGGRPAEHFAQAAEECWSGAYFGYPGIESEAALLPEGLKEIGRREYLPGATSIMAAAFCSAVAGALLMSHPTERRLRVTLHRLSHSGGEDVLQQACEYFGTPDAVGDKATAARTFPTHNATIGLAFESRKIVRSRQSVTSTSLTDTMEALRLNAVSRKMAASVSFVLAIPMLEEPEQPGTSSVIGVLYIDSTADDYYLDDSQLRQLVSMSRLLLEGLSSSKRSKFDRLNNASFPRARNTESQRSLDGNAIGSTLEMVDTVLPPSTSRPFRFNFDHTDFPAA